MISKKGELTTKQLVTIIVLITSFIIILFLFFRLNLGEVSNKEICRNSVLLQERSAFSGPLDCRTNYLCVSGAGECEAITETATAEVDADNKNQVMQALAEEMSDCWWMFGEGEINYGSTGLVESKTEYAICSVVAFDSNVQENVPEISYQEFYDYLRTSRKTQSQTYLQYLYSTNVVEGLDEEDNINFSFSETIDTSRKYSIITGVDNRVGTGEDFRPDEIFNVYIIPTGETSERLSDSREFITKS